MPDSLVVEIVTALEERGLSRHAYQLHNSVDPDALERLVDSIDGEFSISLTVEGVDVEITEEGVRTVSTDEGESKPAAGGSRIAVDTVNELSGLIGVNSRGELFQASVDFLEREIGASMTKLAIARNSLLVPVASTNGGNTGEEHAIPIDTTIPGSVYRSGAGCTIGDILDVRGGETASEPGGGASSEPPHIKHRSLVCAPVDNLGVIVGLAPDPDSFSQDDLAMTAAVGRFIAAVGMWIPDEPTRARDN